MIGMSQARSESPDLQKCQEGRAACQNSGWSISDMVMSKYGPDKSITQNLGLLMFQNTIHWLIKLLSVDY